MTTSYPRSLSHFLNRISNYSRNTFKLIPYRTDNLSPGTIVVCDLPSNALIDTETLCLHFKGSTTSTNTKFTGFPKHIESLIDKIVVEVNGQTLGSCSNLNHVYNMLLQYQNGSDLKAKRKLYQNGAGSATAPVANAVNVPYCIHNFLGFMGSVQPSVIDTALLGNIRIHIHLANANVLVISDVDNLAPNYSLSEVYFTCDTISIDDSVYYALHNEYLLSGNIYEMPFTSIYTALFSVATTSQSSRFSINTQSLDMIGACFLPNHDVPSVVDATIKSSAYFLKYGADISSWAFEINGIQIPAFQASADDAFPLTLNALNLSQDTLGGIDGDIDTVANYKAKFFCPMIRLNHPTEVGERYISGMNTLGSSCNVVYKTSGTGAGGASQLLVVCFCTSTLRCGQGRAITVVA
jgi:hypothetical protein